MLTNGIEWDITVPDTSMDALPAIGSEGKVYVWMQHTESAMTLFGFATKGDRDLFLDLNKVEGVGPKSAVRIMSAASREQLVATLDSGDLARLEKIPGLGKKTAQKMLLALKGKLALDDAPGAKAVGKSAEFADVVSALADMGHDRERAEAAVARIAGELSGDGSFSSEQKERKEEIIFRRAIVELAN